MKTSVIAVVAAVLLLVTSVCGAQIPQKMNYQVMLTDNSDQPLANESVQLIFRIYNVEAGGGSLWTETHNVVTNSIGVASVVLGTYSPLTMDFDGPLWLQVAADGEILSPRRELTSAPYALAGANSGDGHSLDASDGNPLDVVFVGDEGRVTVGVPTNTLSTNKLAVFGEADQTAGYFMADGDYWSGVGMFARSDSSCGVVGNAGTPDDYYMINPTAVAGVARGSYDGGVFSADNGKGVWAESLGGGDALYATALGSGRSGYFRGGNGVEMVLFDSNNNYPVLSVTNRETSGYGDALRVYSEPGANSGSWTLYSRCYNGKAGYFYKSTADGQYAVYVSSPSGTSPGLGVYGYIYSSSFLAREVETTRGKEAVFSISSPEVEMVTSGQGQLAGGTARIEFDRTFAESVTDASDLRITTTPVGGWSALYVDSIDEDGFDVRSDSGRTDIEFHWMAIGREKGQERASEVIILDHDEELRIQRLKEEEMLSGRSDANPIASPVVTTKGNSR